jgi:peptide chain release factor subunit 1
LLSLQSTIFSTFIDNEITTARNIKDRINRHNVIKILTKINEYTKGNKYENGIFIWAGINEYNEFIFEKLIPEIENDKFIYNCSNKFVTDFVQDYMKKLDGSIIFANGNECIIYEWNYKFIKRKHIDANLIKRHKKGGQSSVRFARLAEESRMHYVTYIIDNLNKIKTENNWIFGSKEILDMIFERKKDIYINISNGGFYNFDDKSILNQSYWIQYLENKSTEKYKKYYEKIIYYLDTNPDFLDFDINQKENMKFYMIKEIKEDKMSDKKIPWIEITDKYYSRLNIFEYIGVKYFVD